MADIRLPSSEIPLDNARLHLSLLGPPAVTLDGEPFVLSRRQARALLYYLADRGTPVPREQLIYLLWPDTPQSKARRYLTRLLSYLRRALPEDELVSDQQGIHLDSGLVWCDSRQFEHLCKSGNLAELAEAVDLYRGPFLHGFSLPDSLEFDLWVSQEQRRYERLCLSALAQLVEQAAEAGDNKVAIDYAQKYLAVDELAEPIHRRLVALYGAVGDRAAARRQYERCLTILERELGVAPLPETRAAFESAIREPTGGAKPLQVIDSETAGEPIWTTLPTLALPLVGREQAWQELTNVFRRYRTGGVIFIAGEPGIGKSRLLQEFATVQASRLILTGNSHVTTRDVPYQPLTQAMRLALERPALWSGIQPIWLAEATRILPDLRARFPDLRDPLEVEPDQAQARLFEALSQIFKGIAQNNPLLLCLDDLHWADEATLGWLNYLGDRLAGSDLCLLATYRSQEAEPLAGLRDTLRRTGLVATVTLTGLGTEAIEGLLRQLPEEIPQAHLLALRLQEATAGNPFFALETIRNLWERGWLNSPPDQFPLPQTVQETIQGRLARLEPIDRQILAAATVLFPDLEFEVLGQTAGRSEAEALDGLDRLLEHQILISGPDGLSFHHDLFRAVVYEDLNPWRRRALHRRAAEALIDFHRRDLDSVAPQVARHYDTAGEAESAVEWYTRAAEVAQNQYATEETISALERAIALLDEIPEDREHSARLHESLADALVIAAQYQGADAAYQKALERCPESERLWRAGLCGKIASIYPQQGRVQESESVLDQALNALGSGPGDLPVVDWWQAWLDVQLSRYEAFYFQARLEEMDALSLRIEPVLGQFATPDHRCTYYHSLSMSVYRRNRYWRSSRAVEYLEKALQIAQSLGNLVKIAHHGFFVSFAYLFNGEFEKAHVKLRQSLAEADDIGYLPVQNQCLVYLTILYRLTGNSGGALAVQDRCYEVAEKVGAPYYLGAAEANQAWLLFLDGQEEQAEALARRSLDHWLNTAYPFQWLAHWPLLAMALARDDLEAAVASAAAMLDPVQQRLKDDVTDALELAVRAWETGEGDITRRRLDQALTLAWGHHYL